MIIHTKSIQFLISVHTEEAESIVRWQDEKKSGEKAGNRTCVWQEGHGSSGVAGRSPVLRLIVEARGLRSGQLAQGLVQHFGLAVLAGQRVAGGVAEQHGRLQRGREEDVSVLLGVLERGRGIACRLLETEGERWV